MPHKINIQVKIQLISTHVDHHPVTPKPISFIDPYNFYVNIYYHRFKHVKIFFVLFLKLGHLYPKFHLFSYIIIETCGSIFPYEYLFLFRKDCILLQMVLGYESFKKSCKFHDQAFFRQYSIDYTANQLIIMRCQNNSLQRQFEDSITFTHYDMPILSHDINYRYTDSNVWQNFQMVLFQHQISYGINIVLPQLFRCQNNLVAKLNELKHIIIYMNLQSLKSSFCDNNDDFLQPWWQRTRNECSDYIRLKTFFQQEENTSTLKTQNQNTNRRIVLPSKHVKTEIRFKSKTSSNTYNSVVQKFQNIQPRYLLPSRVQLRADSLDNNKKELPKLFIVRTPVTRSSTQSPAKIQRNQGRLYFDPYQLDRVRRKPVKTINNYTSQDEFSDDNILI